jgi:anti-sigma-K factor RskA
MNTPADPRHDDLRYAEYVLGVLDADARAAVEQEIHDDPHAAAAVAKWQRRLIPLADNVDDIDPAPYVWVRIRDTLQLATPAGSAGSRPPVGLWDNLRLWRWLGVGASVVAAACLVIMLVTPHQATAPSTHRAGYMASRIEQDNGVTGWTATMDLQHARMIVVPATPLALAQDHAPELWLIPPGAKPIPLGVIARDRPTSIALPPALLAQLGANAVLAVSVEPPGGSSTGQPTGPVIAKGTIGGA